MRKKLRKHLSTFIESPSTSTILLLGATVLGLALANSPLADQYHHLLEEHIGFFTIEEWINDVLMAIFFLLVGLEVKREILFGELNTNSKRILPGIAAAMGVVFPALIYYLIAGANPNYSHGWAIPTATDIAFALGVVTALGSRVPMAMKVFLTALAVIDDLIAILIIAIFYTASIQWTYLVGALIIIGILVYINKKNYARPMSYIPLGIALWFCVFQSGLHATMAGVILAMCIPGTAFIGKEEVSPMEDWEHALSNWVSLLIVPVFAFANTGVSLTGFQISDLTHPVVLGVALALVLGKQIGIFGTVWLLVKTKIVPMPAQTRWIHVYGVSVVCGIGFTMSLFVTLLAFDSSQVDSINRAKAGVFLGSMVAAVIGYLILRFTKVNKGDSMLTQSLLQKK